MHDTAESRKRATCGRTARHPWRSAITLSATINGIAPVVPREKLLALDAN
jgi:hypothetical protein